MERVRVKKQHGCRYSQLVRAVLLGSEQREAQAGRDDGRTGPRDKRGIPSQFTHHSLSRGGTGHGAQPTLRSGPGPITLPLAVVGPSWLRSGRQIHPIDSAFRLRLRPPAETRACVRQIISPTRSLLILSYSILFYYF